MNKTTLLAMASAASLATAFTVQPQITVDQFGFRTSAVKVAVLGSPFKGQDASGNNPGLAYTPGSAFKVCLTSDATCATPAFTGTLEQWKAGIGDTAVSGDLVWWADFSTLTTAGEYYILDVANSVQSHPFKIDDNVYADVLKHAGRMFYYQREGMKKLATHAGVWAHDSAFGQDTIAKSWLTKDTPRNVVGGWMDAGDMNKYLPFTAKTLSDLLMAYEYNAGAFPDNWNIPESGNNIPDILDEVKWELDWMLRMQEADGGVHNRVAYQDAGAPVGDPSGITTERYYTAVTSWGTSAFVVGTANASRFYTAFPETKAYADTLLRRALLAWNWLQKNPGVVPSTGLDYGTEKLSQASQAPVDNDGWSRVWAAIELWRATGKSEFKDYADSHYKTFLMDSTKTTGDIVWDPMLGASSPVQKNYGYLQYGLTAGADASITADLKSALQQINWWFNPLDGSTKGEAYRVKNWYFTWGSNHGMANWGLVPIFGIRAGVSEAVSGNFLGRGEEYIHYIHGRNPLGLVYLTNMGTKGANAGAEKSSMEIFHTWFKEDAWDGESSTYGPAPGYLSGGPNQGSTCGTTLTGMLPEEQPPMKAYIDANDYNECQNNWTYTEPGIYYQAAFVHLLSHYVPGAGTKATLAKANYPTDIVLEPVTVVAQRNLTLSAPTQAVVSAVRTDGRTIRLYNGVLSGHVDPKQFASSLPSGLWLIRVQAGSQQSSSWIQVK